MTWLTSKHNIRCLRNLLFSIFKRFTAGQTCFFCCLLNEQPFSPQDIWVKIPMFPWELLLFFFFPSIFSSFFLQPCAAFCCFMSWKVHVQTVGAVAKGRQVPGSMASPPFYTEGEKRTNEKWVKRKEYGTARKRKRLFILGCVLLFVEYLWLTLLSGWTQLPVQHCVES